MPDDANKTIRSTTRNATVPDSVLILICAVAFAVAFGLALYILLYVGRDGMMAYIDWSMNDPVGMLISLGLFAAFTLWGIRESLGNRNRFWRTAEILLGAASLGASVYLYMR